MVANKSKPLRDLPARVNCSLLVIFFGDTIDPTMRLASMKKRMISKEMVTGPPTHGRDGVNLT
jgi:hypothetical protein